MATSVIGHWPILVHVTSCGHGRSGPRPSAPPWHADLLQTKHRLIGLQGLRPPTHQSIEGLHQPFELHQLVRQPPGEIAELWVRRPLGVACYPGQGAIRSP